MELVPKGKTVLHIVTLQKVGQILYIRVYIFLPTDQKIVATFHGMTMRLF
jgi:hypothetical protein